MLLDLPVVAYGVTAVPETMGEAGIVFYRKDFEQLAELIDILLGDEALRQRIIAGQRSRVQHFMEPHVRGQFLAHMEQSGS
jgi:glycosyltransferase involved in cell wall biosynthesis